eukprot:CAMPEP_0176318872 /NCGR_PEP_ID=MMETSP0121_2-20121125/70003_1 /TAXON_ID=160619 /ORGANISM="Kryptoperidinium foliaceum, Strain CCMP 1326" /LENGTH=145 /DNA_ID=CAMNT_0017661189 /DNA_START=477 /DNA_END=911 /DNA_ORIENTATION=+
MLRYRSDVHALQDDLEHLLAVNLREFQDAGQHDATVVVVDQLPGVPGECDHQLLDLLGGLLAEVLDEPQDQPVAELLLVQQRPRGPEELRRQQPRRGGCRRPQPNAGFLLDEAQEGRRHPVALRSWREAPGVRLHEALADHVDAV